MNKDLSIARSISFNEFFSLLTRMHFFYKEKEILVLPCLESIHETWDVLLQNPPGIAHNTFVPSDTGITAICSCWRTSQTCWCLQNGIALNIRDYIKALVQESARILEDPSTDYVQAWFRPGNRIVSKMCGEGSPLYDSKEVYSEIVSCLQYGPTSESEQDSCILPVKPSHKIDVLQEFISKNKSPLFFASEDFGQDLFLDSIGSLFQQTGLTHTRVVDIIGSDSEIQAAVISYHSSPGINFSFLENRIEVIVDKKIGTDSALGATIMGTLRRHSASRRIPVPVIADPKTAELLIRNGAHFQREYMRRIWTKKAYAELYEYITHKYM